MNRSPLTRRALHAALAASALLVLAPASVLAQSDWPTKPVKIFVPFPPGGSTDVVARQLALHLGSAFGQPFVVENRTGAGGNIGTDAVAKAAPDGYTIGLSTSGPLANNKSLYKSMPFDSQKDLTPIALVGEIPLVIVAHPAVKAANLKDFIAASRGATPPYSVGHPGNGTIGHLALESLKSSSGAPLQSIAYRGDTPAMSDLLGGQIQAISAPVTAFIPNIQAGKLNGLAVTSKKRFPGLPNVPTAQEQGLDVEATVWFAIVGPAGLPQPVALKLNREINKYTNSAEGRAKLAQFGMVEANGGPELLGTLMNAEAAKWKKVVEAARISLD
ncbi:Bug family tripartite tricarboxylate transporter substrate binding protein [Hydrogenophaga sp.]|uniref:Bug family tripartite tricarboxylate transporter substrate binding protein n=1 Tax=Hydrogenophaga sp. TaxID=1904254 RepID=UPI003D1343C7